MREAGVDISGQRSRHLQELTGSRFDWVVTVCDRANESCPVFPGAAHRMHVGFDDPPRLAAGLPADEALTAYRRGGMRFGRSSNAARARRRGDHGPSGRPITNQNVLPRECVTRTNRHEGDSRRGPGHSGASQSPRPETSCARMLRLEAEAVEVATRKRRRPVTEGSNEVLARQPKRSRHKEGETVVDLGSGGGFDCFLRRGRSVRWSLIGVEMTAEMVAKARAKEQRARRPTSSSAWARSSNCRSRSTVDVISRMRDNMRPDRRESSRMR